MAGEAGGAERTGFSGVFVNTTGESGGGASRGTSGAGRAACRARALAACGCSK